MSEMCWDKMIVPHFNNTFYPTVFHPVSSLWAAGGSWECCWCCGATMIDANSICSLRKESSWIRKLWPNYHISCRFNRFYFLSSMYVCIIHVCLRKEERQKVRSVQDNLLTITYINSADNASVVLYYCHQFYWCC